MRDSFPLPALDSILDDRDGVLYVSGSAGQPVLQFRVDEGLAFVRIPIDERERTPARAMTPAGGASMSLSRHWHEAPADMVLALFASNSPVASWLRVRGVDVLRLALLDVGGPVSTREEDF